MLKKLPSLGIKLVELSNSVATKKGKSDGITEFISSSKEVLTANTFLWEKINKQNVNKIKLNGII